MGISNVMSQSLISANNAMKLAHRQQGIKKQMEGKAGVLRSEIKQDGGTSKMKQEELEAVEAKAKDAESVQMNTLSDVNSRIKEAAKEDQKVTRTQEAAEKRKAEKKEAEKKAQEKRQEKKAEKAAQEDRLSETVTTDGDAVEVRSSNRRVSVDIVSDGVTLNAHTDEPVGGQVDAQV